MSLNCYWCACSVSRELFHCFILFHSEAETASSEDKPEDAVNIAASTAEGGKAEDEASQQTETATDGKAQDTVAQES